MSKPIKLTLNYQKVSKEQLLLRRFLSKITNPTMFAKLGTIHKRRQHFFRIFNMLTVFSTILQQF